MECVHTSFKGPCLGKTSSHNHKCVSGVLQSLCAVVDNSVAPVWNDLVCRSSQHQHMGQQKHRGGKAGKGPGGKPGKGLGGKPGKGQGGGKPGKGQGGGKPGRGHGNRWAGAGWKNWLWQTGVRTVRLREKDQIIIVSVWGKSALADWCQACKTRRERMLIY